MQKTSTFLEKLSQAKTQSPSAHIPILYSCRVLLVGTERQYLVQQRLILQKWQLTLYDEGKRKTFFCPHQWLPFYYFVYIVPNSVLLIPTDSTWQWKTTGPVKVVNHVNCEVVTVSFGVMLMCAGKSCSLFYICDA